MTESLCSFSSSDTETDLRPDAESVARSATTVTAPDRDSVDWAASDEDWGLKTRRPRSSINTSAGRARPQQTRWVIEGDVGAYVATYGGGDLLAIPETYGGFSDIETRVAFVDGLTDDSYGYGIDGQAVEKALRVLTGGGRYTASKYTLIPCGRQPWVLTGPEGTLLCSCMPIDRPDAGGPTTQVDTSAGTLDIEEDHPGVLAGAARFVDLLQDVEGAAIDRCTYDSLRGQTRHSLVEEDDTEWTMAADDLAQLAGLAADPAVIQETVGRGIQPPTGGDPVVADWDGPDHAVGDRVDGEIIAGYEFAWEQSTDCLEAVATVRTYRVRSSHSAWVVDYQTDRLESVVR